jgi:hypothetical protein
MISPTPKKFKVSYVEFLKQDVIALSKQLYE